MQGRCLGDAHALRTHNTIDRGTWPDELLPDGLRARIVLPSYPRCTALCSVSAPSLSLHAFCISTRPVIPRTGWSGDHCAAVHAGRHPHQCSNLTHRRARHTRLGPRPLQSWTDGQRRGGCCRRWRRKPRRRGGQHCRRAGRKAPPLQAPVTRGRGGRRPPRKSGESLWSERGRARQPELAGPSSAISGTGVVVRL